MLDLNLHREREPDMSKHTVPLGWDAAEAYGAMSAAELREAWDVEHEWQEALYLERETEPQRLSTPSGRGLGMNSSI